MHEDDIELHAKVDDPDKVDEREERLVKLHSQAMIKKLIEEAEAEAEAAAKAEAMAAAGAAVPDAARSEGQLSGGRSKDSGGKSKKSKVDKVAIMDFLANAHRSGLLTTQHSPYGYALVCHLKFTCSKIEKFAGSCVAKIR